MLTDFIEQLVKIFIFSLQTSDGRNRVHYQFTLLMAKLVEIWDHDKGDWKHQRLIVENNSEIEGHVQIIGGGRKFLIVCCDLRLVRPEVTSAGTWGHDTQVQTRGEGQQVNWQLVNDRRVIKLWHEGGQGSTTCASFILRGLWTHLRTRHNPFSGCQSLMSM